MKVNPGIERNKDMIGVFLATLVILSIPLVAMRFTDEVDWSLGDFVSVGALLLGTGLAYVLLARRMISAKNRIIVGVVLLAVFVLIWAELAVGLFGTPLAGN